MPGISRLFKPDSNQPELAALFRSNAARHTGGCTLSARQIINFHAQSGLKRALAANSTTFGIHKDGIAVFRKIAAGIHAADAQRNLGTNARAEASLNFGGQNSRFFS